MSVSYKSYMIRHKTAWYKTSRQHSRLLLPAMVEYISSFSEGDAVAPIDKVDDGGGHIYDIMLMTIYEYVDINDDNDDDDKCCVAFAYSKWQTESDIMMWGCCRLWLQR